MFTSSQSAHPTLAAITKPLLVVQVRSGGRRVKQKPKCVSQTTVLTGRAL